uniref:Uncharacterized protein n=1 Tax=Timema douglasi TaxID=61478 RepID=A0A7R8VN28_TIMDO|nr:unnamed protein product [Timema douglasi]
MVSSPMASLVLTDGFEKLPEQIIYPYAEPYDLQEHRSARRDFWSERTVLPAAEPNIGLSPVIMRRVNQVVLFVGFVLIAVTGALARSARSARSSSGFYTAHQDSGFAKVAHGKVAQLLYPAGATL